MPVSLKHLSKAASSTGVGRPAPKYRANDALGAGFGSGFDHRAVGADIGQHHIDARQRFQIAHVELGCDGVFAHRLMVINGYCRHRQRNRAALNRATEKLRPGRWHF